MAAASPNSRPGRSANEGAPTLDVRIGLSQAGGDQALYHDVLHLFLEELRAITDDLPRAATDAAALHRLKGSAAAVGATRLAQWCAQPGDVLALPPVVASTMQAVAEAMERMAPAGAVPNPVPADTDPASPVVVVVEDSPSHGQALAGLLAAEYQVHVVQSAAGALAFLGTLPDVDLVLADVNMPEMDGFELCRQIQADPRWQQIPVVFVTARNGAVDEEQGLALGAADYVHKPVQPALLRARVRNAIVRKRQADALARAAGTDPLTGLANRREALKVLGIEWARARRTGFPLSVLMIDIDHFKAYNDSLGHLAGDDCLVDVSQELSASLRRPPDVLARWGGEEFLAVLPGTHASGATHVGHSLVAAVAERRIPHPTREWVTVSAGCATAIDFAGDWADLVMAADRAMYLAKTQGRGRLVAAGPDDLAPPTSDLEQNVTPD